MACLLRLALYSTSRRPLINRWRIRVDDPVSAGSRTDPGNLYHRSTSGLQALGWLRTGAARLPGRGRRMWPTISNPQGAHPHSKLSYFYTWLTTDGCYSRPMVRRDDRGLLDIQYSWTVPLSSRTIVTLMEVISVESSTER